MKRRILLVCAVLLTGCAAKLVPDDYTGPTALVRDSSVNSGPGKSSYSQYFAVIAVDGKEVPNSFSQALAGAEGYANFQVHERKVPVRSMKVTLRAVAYFPNGLKQPAGPSQMDHVSAGIIQNTVSFLPVAGETYVVRGKVGERGGAAWIETAAGQRVTDTTTVRKPGAAQ